MIGLDWVGYIKIIGRNSWKSLLLMYTLPLHRHNVMIQKKFVSVIITFMQIYRVPTLLYVVLFFS